MVTIAALTFVVLFMGGLLIYHIRWSKRLEIESEERRVAFEEEAKRELAQKALAKKRALRTPLAQRLRSTIASQVTEMDEEDESAEKLLEGIV